MKPKRVILVCLLLPIALCAIFYTAGFRLNRGISDTSCDREHEAYKTLEQHYVEWFERLRANPNHTILIDTSKREYAVRYQEPINDGDVSLIYIQTFEAWHGTPTEGYGYAYTPVEKNGSINSVFYNQQFKKLSNNLYCYYPVSEGD